jgi:hypothetical protein
MIITVYNNNTKEVLACINTDTKSRSIVKKGVIYNVSENEPVFTNKDGKLYLVNNVFIMKGRK